MRSHRCASRRNVRPIRALALLALLAACGDEGGTLRVFHPAGEPGDPSLAIEQQIADRFAERRPGLRVVVEPIGGAYGETVLGALASGAAPDLVRVEARQLPALLEGGYLLDMTRLAGRAGYDRDRVFPSVRDGFEPNGTLWAIPYEASPVVVFFRPDVFQRYDVGVPASAGWDWSDFLDTARRLTRDPNRDGLIDTHPIDARRSLEVWLSWIWSGGGDILDARGEETRGSLDAPPAVAAVDFLAGFVRPVRQVPAEGPPDSDPVLEARFTSATIAMLVGDRTTFARLRAGDAGLALDLGAVPVPHREGEEAVAAVSGAAWAVPVGAPRAPLSVELAAYLASEEAQRMRASGRRAMPSLMDLAEEAAAADSTGVEAAFVAAAKGGRPTWGFRASMWARIEEVVLGALDRHFRGEVDFREGAAASARELDAGSAGGG